MMNLIHIGLEVKPEFGVEVVIPRTHTFISGLTRSGKSVTARKILSQIGKTLIIDCKTPRDYEGVGVEIPLYIEDRSDPLMIKRLLESSSKLWLRKEFPELIDLCKVGKTWEGVYEATKRKLEWKDPKGKGVHPVVKERLEVLEFLLGKLIQEMRTLRFSKELELSAEICVMDIHKLSLGLQQLVVHSVLSKVRNEHTDENVLVDEGHRFTPEQKPSAARDAIILFIQEGAAKRDFLYMSDQTITGIDKDVLKQMHVWILGCQTEKNEADRTLDQLTKDIGLKRRDIYQLRVGHFLVNTREWTKLAYVIPDGMNEELAFKVLRGEIKPEEAFSQLLEVDEDLTYKPLWEEEKAKRETLEKEFEQRLDQERHRIAVQAQDTVDKRLQEITETHVPKAQFKEIEDKLRASEKDAEFGRKCKAFFQEIVPEASTSTPNMLSISVADIDERINQRLSSGPGPIPVVSVNVDERIKELVKNETINRLVRKIQALPEPAKKAAWWLHEKKQVNVRALYNYVYERPLTETGRVPGSFYANVVNPLEDAWLIINKGGDIRWSLQEKLAAELKDVLSNSDMENVPKYLASLLL